MTYLVKLASWSDSSNISASNYYGITLCGHGFVSLTGRELSDCFMQFVLKVCEKLLQLVRISIEPFECYLSADLDLIH